MADGSNPHVPQRARGARVSGATECKRLAAEHVDMIFHVVGRLGYGAGLDAAARGTGLAGKPEGMSGDLAPVL